MIGSKPCEHCYNTLGKHLDFLKQLEVLIKELCENYKYSKKGDCKNCIVSSEDNPCNSLRIKFMKDKIFREASNER